MGKLLILLNATSSYYAWGVTNGRRYYRLYHEVNGMRSAFAFIDRVSGVIYKAAGWKARSNTVVGDVSDPETFVESLPNFYKD